jgi:Fis family transcriptional regulator
MATLQESTHVARIQTRRAEDLTLSAHVKIAVEHYLSQLNGHDPNGLYDMVITEVEKPLLEAALQHAGHNQSRAAKILGISRSTLRNKILRYDIS